MYVGSAYHSENCVALKTFIFVLIRGENRVSLDFPRRGYCHCTPVPVVAAGLVVVVVGIHSLSQPMVAVLHVSVLHHMRLKNILRRGVVWSPISVRDRTLAEMCPGIRSC